MCTRVVDKLQMYCNVRVGREAKSMHRGDNISPCGKSHLHWSQLKRTIKTNVDERCGQKLSPSAPNKHFNLIADASRKLMHALCRVQNYPLSRAFREANSVPHDFCDRIFQSMRADRPNISPRKTYPQTRRMQTWDQSDSTQICLVFFCSVISQYFASASAVILIW